MTRVCVGGVSVGVGVGVYTRLTLCRSRKKQSFSLKPRLSFPGQTISQQASAILGSLFITEQFVTRAQSV